MRSILIAWAVALGVVAVALGAGSVISLPVTLKLAVPTYDTASRKLFETAAEQFRSQRQPLRLEIVPAADPATALTAVEHGHADLAVARAEEVLRAKVQTALIIRQEAAVIMTAKTSKVKKFADIIGASVGVVREGPASGSALKAVLEYYALDPGKLKFTPLASGDVATAFRSGRYGDGEQKTFFDRYNDWIYIAMMVASGIGSAIAGMFGWLDTKRRRRTMSRVFEIERLIEGLKDAETGDALDALARQVDGLFGQALRQAVDGTLDHAGLETFKLALNEARSRIDRRRNKLADKTPNEAAARLRSV